ncbi:unnamed protein product [Arctogadus glacialis]
MSSKSIFSSPVQSGTAVFKARKTLCKCFYRPSHCPRVDSSTPVFTRMRNESPLLSPLADGLPLAAQSMGETRPGFPKNPVQQGIYLTHNWSSAVGVGVVLGQGNGPGLRNQRNPGVGSTRLIPSHGLSLSLMH